MSTSDEPPLFEMQYEMKMPNDIMDYITSLPQPERDICSSIFKGESQKEIIKRHGLSYTKIRGSLKRVLKPVAMEYGIVKYDGQHDGKMTADSKGNQRKYLLGPSSRIFRDLPRGK